MVDQEEIYKVMQFLHDNRTFHDMDEIHIREKGIGATLVFLEKSNVEVKSVDISREMNISSARMAVILKKLEHKHMITKSTSTADSRAITIELTDKGRILAQKIEQDMYNTISIIIEEIGIEEFYATFEKIATIKRILDENKPKDMEVLHD